MAPQWLTAISWLALIVAFVTAIWLTIEQIRHPQRMWIMNLVWPITALYMGPIALWAYYRMGLRGAKDRMTHEQHARPSWESTFISATHCGAGCSLGDIIAEFTLFYTGFMIVGSEFGSMLIAAYVAAYILGIAFQYFAIAPMRGNYGIASLWAAIKSDTLTLTAFEIGLFGWMAIFHFLLFHPSLMPNQAAYWFMMQIGMCLGFLTSYPVNGWLIKWGWKEAM